MMAVLLVDDHAMFREALVMALGHAVPGLAIHSAANGQEALEVLEQHASIQHVIMDVYLPDMAGADLLKRLRQRRARLRILVLSASQDPEDMRQAMEAGAQGFLNKSASCQELAAALNAVNDAAAPSSRVVSAAAPAVGASDDAALLRALTPRQSEVLRLMCVERVVTRRRCQIVLVEPGPQSAAERGGVGKVSHPASGLPIACGRPES